MGVEDPALLSGPFTFFHHVGVGINSSLSTFIHMEGKEMPLHKII